MSSLPAVASSNRARHRVDDCGRVDAIGAVEVGNVARLSKALDAEWHHPLAAHDGPISDTELLNHRAVAVADSAQRLTPITVNILPGQDVLTVSSTQAKIEAQIRCMGCGYIPEPMARPHVEAGRLVVKQVERTRQPAQMGYAWRSGVGGKQRKRLPMGLALQWWLQQLESQATRRALLERHAGLPQVID